MSVSRDPQKVNHPQHPRAWRRGNAIKWFGVKPDGKVEHPALIKKVSLRGETHWEETLTIHSNVSESLKELLKPSSEQMTSWLKRIEI